MNLIDASKFRTALIVVFIAGVLLGAGFTYLARVESTRCATWAYPDGAGRICIEVDPEGHTRAYDPH